MTIREFLPYYTSGHINKLKRPGPYAKAIQNHRACLAGEVDE